MFNLCRSFVRITYIFKIRVRVLGVFSDERISGIYCYPNSCFAASIEMKICYIFNQKQSLVVISMRVIIIWGTHDKDFIF